MVRCLSALLLAPDCIWCMFAVYRYDRIPFSVHELKVLYTGLIQYDTCTVNISTKRYLLTHSLARR